MFPCDRHRRRRPDHRVLLAMCGRLGTRSMPERVVGAGRRGRQGSRATLGRERHTTARWGAAGAG